uniref:WSC domain-containing protein n=1 Tax=Magallana gigas TaxID=29159 RepID=A0A8W8NMZ7_MAGGI
MQTKLIDVMTDYHFWRVLFHYFSVARLHHLKYMDHSYQLYLFVLSTTTLFTDSKPAGDVSHSWFDAQRQCFGWGLTTEKDKSDHPYWTGVYRRLTPWINILGCYPDSTNILQHVVNKSMIISSVGVCQEMCYRSNGYKFAVKMNTCLCIESVVPVNSSNRLSPADCNYKCEDNTDVIYSGDCGGISAYNLYEIQEVNFSTEDTCLSLQCSKKDKKFIPKRCSEALDKVCENINIPDNGFASSWNLSMEQCRKSRHSGYVFGEVILNNPRLVCRQLPSHLLVVWVGVRRQKYKNIDRGASDELALKISFPVITVFIILLLCAMAAVFYSRRRKMAKTDGTTKAQIESGPRKNIGSNVDSVQNNSYFVLEQCPQYISKGSYSANESPYKNSEDGVYDHLRDKNSRKPEVEDTYQHASAGVNRDMSEYDTMANAVNKKQEEDVSYDYSHQDTNRNYAYDLRAKNDLTDYPYDVAV